MIIPASKLREEIKEEFPSLKSVLCEYVECLDESYLVPPHEKALELIEKYWEPIKAINWVKNIGDCDNRATILYADVHRHRILNIEEIPEEERVQWSFGFASGENPWGNMHTFNILRSDQGIFVFDNKLKPVSGYRPFSARF